MSIMKIAALFCVQDEQAGQTGIRETVAGEAGKENQVLRGDHENF